MNNMGKVEKIVQSAPNGIITAAQGGDHGKRQHKCGVAPQRVPVFAELLLVGFKDVVHNLEYLLPGSMDQRETGQGPYP